MTYRQFSGNKYHSKSTEYAGQVYHSKFEAAYAKELNDRIKSKEIKKWDRQVRLDLRVNGIHICNYYIDFIIYYSDGSREFCEVKGFATDLWRIKWAILEATFDDFKQNPNDRMILIRQGSLRFPVKKLST